MGPARDQLVGISSNGREWGAKYDALGRRVRKYWPGRTTEFYWDHDRLPAEIRGTGNCPEPAPQSPLF
ncbi:MAG: hypothetical protein J2P21_13160 [Chloracidobacterium sp.]|nr:hypothetical protein [Chloracidobacterium sp.]